MLSRHSFNALLKTLEEPPEYVKFLLATTDPQKLPITILSRCMQFHLRALEQSQIQQHLEFILTQEQIPYELSALAKLAKAAQGSIRDALSLTDQAIAVSNANIALPMVSQMLGLIDDHQPLELVQALANADGEKAMAVIQSVAEKGVDWQQLLSDTAETLHQIAMLQLLKHAHQEETPLHFLAKQISPEDVQFFYQVMLTGKKELPFAPEQRSGVEMTILRALAFHPKNMATTTTVVTATPTKPVAPVQSPNSISQLRERLAQQQNAAQTATTQAVVSEQNFAKNSPQQSAYTASSSTPDTQNGISDALMAMQARKQLKAKQAQDNEKKKPDELVALPTRQLASKQNVQQRFASLALTQETEIKSAPKAQHLEQSDEDYRWTWLNPELESQEEAPKPSEIKQAILQDKTPELVKKTIELGCEQDEWSRIIQDLKLGGMTRQLVLNSYLAEKKDKHLTLVLKPSMAHLKNDESMQSLTTAFGQVGLTYEIQLGESHEHQTPLEIRRTIFENLTQEAKKALQSDDKLQLLQQAFDAQMDESTIRAVVE